MLFSVQVVETRSYSVTYTVEADDMEDAISLASNGETKSETEGELREVIDRVVVSCKPTAEG